MIEFNINEWVQVRLTDVGRAELHRQREELNKRLKRPFMHSIVNEDADGWSRWQMWNLMQRLGHLCGLGTQIPFETAIRIEVKP